MRAAVDQKDATARDLLDKAMELFLPIPTLGRELQGFVEIEDKAAKAAEEEELDDEDWTDLERFQVAQVFSLLLLPCGSISRIHCIRDL